MCLTLLLSLVLSPSLSSTHLTSPVLVLLMTPKVSFSFQKSTFNSLSQAKTANASTMVSSMSTRRHWLLTVLAVFTVVSSFHVLVSSSTVVCTSVSTILLSQSSLVTVDHSWPHSFWAGVSLLSLAWPHIQLILSAAE